jgi:hypothetical protein
MADFATDFAALNTNLTALVTDDQGLRAQVADLQEKLDAANAQIASLDPNAAAELSTAQAQIATMNAEINKLINPVVVTAATINSQVGSEITTTVAATGGVGPYTWTASSLPDGVTMDSDGNVSGTPTNAVSSEVQATATDTEGNSGVGAIDFVIAAAPVEEPAPAETTTDGTVPTDNPAPPLDPSAPVDSSTPANPIAVPDGTVADI